MGRSRKILLDRENPGAHTDPYGNNIESPEADAPGQDYPADQEPEAARKQTAHQAGGGKGTPDTVSQNKPLTAGIVKNISVDWKRRSFAGKWLQALFSGIPFTLDDSVTRFQVYPAKTALNVMGNACDQVVVYGSLPTGAIAAGNDVEVYGYRDADNSIIAREIRNKATGTASVPHRTIPVWAVWAITLLIFAAVFIVAVGSRL